MSNVVPPEVPEDLPARIAVVREAKLMARLHDYRDHLRDDETDLALVGDRDVLVSTIKARGVQPCAKCRRKYGVAHHPDQSPRPLRISGKPFGIDGSLCKSCFDVLSRRRRADSKSARRSMHA